MTPAALDQIFEIARRDRLFQSTPSETFRERTDLPWLDLSNRKITSIPESIGNLTYLTRLNLRENELNSLPESIGKLINLIELDLTCNKFTTLPESLSSLPKLIELIVIGNLLNTLPDSIAHLVNLTTLDLRGNRLEILPSNIVKLSKLTKLDLGHNQLSNLPDNIGNATNLIEVNLNSNRLNSLPENIGNLVNLNKLDLSFNHLTSLPTSLRNLSKLVEINLAGNPLADLSVLQNLPKLKRVKFFSSPIPTRFLLNLPRRYWTKLSDWKPEWLLDEDNVEIRRALIEQLGYEKICEALNAVTIDSWREYTLLKIDGVEKIYDDEEEPIDTEPMVLLKMTCPSTAHIHILRVPPEIDSAEAAITWVNHGIHPDKFATQT
ncbi:leucine-rich repeat domain-containing protein [Chamaesiphon polymorphus]|nr:leucine-rich repeat domain-containing protein [Chamaesiphon polymorphus]